MKKRSKDTRNSLFKIYKNAQIISKASFSLHTKITILRSQFFVFPNTFKTPLVENIYPIGFTSDVHSTDFFCIRILITSKAEFQHIYQAYFFILWPEYLWLFLSFGDIHNYFGTNNFISWVVFMNFEKTKFTILRRPVLFMNYLNQKK